MLKHSKVWLALLAATVTLGALVGTASARNLSSSSQTIRATWTSMEFAAPNAGVNVRCQVTLEGSLHTRTIAKVLGSLIGYITRADVNEGSCTGGRARPRNETLPWHVTYQGFTGTLPNITSEKTSVPNSAFDIIASFFGIPVTCTYRRTAISGTYNREAGGALTTAVVAGSNLTPDQAGCEAGELRGTSNSLTVLNSTARITVTLI